MSVCLCQIPEPDKELVEKYEGLKATFYKRLLNLYQKTHETLVPLAEGTITGDKAKEVIEKVKEDSRAQAAGKVIVWV